VLAGSFAPSSRRRTANSEPLGIDELLGFVGELIDPPEPTPARRLGGLAGDTPAA
jgi:hypothetical protein